MKTIIVICSIVMVSFTAFSQDLNKPVANLSPKELMKRQVMRMNVQQTGFAYQNGRTAYANLTRKEQMKMADAKINFQGFFPGSYNYQQSCPSCLIFSNLAPKERMKAQLARIYQCATGDTRGCENLMCRYCAKALTLK